MKRVAGLDPKTASHVLWEWMSSIYDLPSDLLFRMIDRRENRAWDPRAVSPGGAQSYAQVKPIAVCTRIPDCNRLAMQVKTLREIPRNDTRYVATRDRLAGLEQSLKSRLGTIETRLRSPPASFNLCWGGRILFDNARICNGDAACALAGYLNGEFSSRYIAEVLE